jgi:hypothetical protein
VLARRLLLLAAVLLLLAAFAAALAPAPPGGDSTATPRSSLPQGTVVAEEIPIDERSNIPITVRRGDTLQLEVAGDTLDSVLIERLDLIDAIEPTTPARFDYLVDAAAGSYPIRLVEADRRIGTLEITG